MPDGPFAVPETSEIHPAAQQSEVTNLGSGCSFMPENQTMPSLADDVLRGAQAIADAVNLPRRKVFHKLENGHIPATKEGGVWVTTRSQLKKFYNSPTNNIPPVVAEEQTTTASPKRRKKSRSRRGRS
jgi:hypothetical protein